MKNIQFPYVVIYDSRNAEKGMIEVSLSEEDARRLIRSANEGGRRFLGDDESIADICLIVFGALSERIVQRLMNDPEPVRKALYGEDSCDPRLPLSEEQYAEYLEKLSITVFYPEGMQML